MSTRRLEPLEDGVDLAANDVRHCAAVTSQRLEDSVAMLYSDSLDGLGREQPEPILPEPVDEARQSFDAMRCDRISKVDPFAG